MLCHAVAVSSLVLSSASSLARPRLLSNSSARRTICPTGSPGCASSVGPSRSRPAAGVASRSTHEIVRRRRFDEMRRLQLWSTHKWLCGKPTSIFTFAPLNAEERDTTLDMIRLPDARRWKALSEVEISEADGWREGNYENLVKH
ncbi:hypothetical protein DMC30DRAFT_237458 [Rhodotorula diobovata]|uniref:Uncharacterized protein n=1 Tax=Rhodotorula diobovata TaxID=5288 RepID=A0A5C5FV67_9BASI|nr:hypothetical protein DMC30DRAFT_237458 [Rhodotorula diobovata]